VNPANTITGTEGSSIGNTLLTTFIDSDTPTLGDLSATINWGNGTSSSGTIAFVSGDTYDLYGSHTYFEEGGYTYSVTVDDSANSLSGGNNGSATIADAPLTAGSPVNGSGMPLVAIGGVLGTFLDANPFGPISDFTATIDWGDGTAVSGGTITQPGGVGTPFDVTGTHTYSVDGLYNPTITIDDDGGSITTDMASEQITPEPGTFVFCGTGILFAYAALRLRRKNRSRC
jgi:hypothetical protein